MIKFGELKQYISRIARVSICFHDGHYHDFTMISDIADGKYDDLYVYGIGMVDVEFPLDVYKKPKPPADVSERTMVVPREYFMGGCLEIVLQEEPRYISRQDEQALRFCDVREYLQIGMNFSVVMREDWSEEHYTWRSEIPEKYDDLYVYGIGIEDSEELREAEYARIKMMDTILVKQIVIVLARTPRKDIRTIELDER